MQAGCSVLGYKKFLTPHTLLQHSEYGCQITIDCPAIDILQCIQLKAAGLLGLKSADRALTVSQILWPR